MPIPEFDHNQVLPPHSGDPTKESSPYVASVLEFCQRFATSPERIQILRGFLAFRAELQRLGLHTGFQWLDGSFCENIEVSEKRPPNDLDLVTVCQDISQNEKNIISDLPEFIDPAHAKKRFLLDHYFIDTGMDPLVVVDYTCYWIQLFSHTRKGIWKGMVQVPLNTPNDDALALAYLNEHFPSHEDA